MIISTLLLCILGIVTLYSSSPPLAISQALYALTGLIFFLALRHFDYRALNPLVKPLYIVIILLLVTLFMIGFETRGSIRWIPLGFINLQPSELAKPVLILALGFFWAKNKTSWQNIFKSLLILLPIFGLIFKQPDLGTSLTIGFIWFVMLLCANVEFFKVSLIALTLILLAPLGWFFMQAYQHQRIISFLFPTQDPLGKGFHVIQSMIAVGSGQFFGRGLGRGTQSRLQFLPEFRTDFIFAFIAEELGFMGSLIVLCLYAYLIYVGFNIFSNTQDRLGQLIASGVVSMIVFQVIVNIGMNSGIMPVTGITLPLLSYGGSSMIATFICLGVLSSVAKHSPKQKEVTRFDLKEG